MTPTPPKNQPPITLTIDDLTQTRHSSTTARMHWPVDEETTRRLNRVIRLDVNSPTPRWRRLLRWLKRTS
jgi:hypothetical protein